ncbi:MAG: arsenate reductase family protein [Vampirovibrionales bacterium]|nr:arsenate reductase family protein [Vampirovibrionales bacterium]
MSPATKTLTVETLYWLPYCSTCQKAEAWLTAHGISIEKSIDVKTQPLARDVIEELAEKVGGVESLFSKRAMKYRSLGLDKMTLNASELLDHMAAEYTFIKRPVIVLSDGRAHAGFSEKQYKLLFGG